MSKLPLVRIEKEYFDILYICKNGWQSVGTEINKEIAEELIRKLKEYYEL